MSSHTCNDLWTTLTLRLISDMWDAPQGEYGRPAIVNAFVEIQIREQRFRTSVVHNDNLKDVSEGSDHDPIAGDVPH
jgi:hypothetical protein